ncbi:MAG: LPS-assembly protein LptD [Burkholderiales bacterium]|nr:LPS-assembly protein LptD [Rhodocyclaceae bacterium]
MREFYHLNSVSITLSRFSVPECAPQSAPKHSRLKPASMAVLGLLIIGFACVPVRAQQATAPTQTELDDALSEGPKINRPFPAPGAALRPKDQKGKSGPQVIEAERIEGIMQKRATATGNVVLSQDNLTLTADRIDYDRPTDTAKALGNVRLDRGGDIFTGTSMELALDTNIGYVELPTFLFGRSPGRPTQRFEARGEAVRMRMEGPEQERLFTTTYTTCRPGENEWYLKVSELGLDRAKNIGTGYNAYVEFKGLPIMYVPFMTFPLNNERKSGFLPPSIGSSSNSGGELAIPYYWNIANETDATITPKLFTKRGVQLGAELRYLRPSAFGQLDAEFLPNDRKADKNRLLLSMRHFQNLSPFLGRGWSGSINAQKVSDDNYFRDLSTRISNTTQTNLARDASIAYASDFGNFNFRTLNFQTLQDPLAPIGTPYKLQPQLAFNARPARMQGFEFNTFGEYSDFRHPTLVNGRRLLMYPSMSYAITRPFGFIMPKVGYHVTRYDLTKNETGFEGGNRALPIISIDSGLAFERPVQFFSRAITQTLEPRLFYLYVPYRNQTKLPQFSTSETDFNFAQIFNENLFVGGDRISDAKQLTAAVTTRFIDDATGIERLRAVIGQRYYFRPQQVTLSGTALGITPSASNDGAVRTASKSDLLFAVGGQLTDAWSLDSSFQYSTSASSFQKSNISARYNADAGRLINFSYRYTRADLKQIDISTQWPFSKAAPGWTLLARANHSLRDRRLLEGLFGVEYNKGCWEFRLVAHRFTTATNQYSNSFQFQLELNGLSKLGVNPFETIKQNIAGYRRSGRSDER